MGTTEAFTEVAMPDAPNALALRCPRCGVVTVKRRDSVAVGLHWITCGNFTDQRTFKDDPQRLYALCDFSSDRIVLLDGQEVAKEASDH